MKKKKKKEVRELQATYSNNTLKINLKKDFKRVRNFKSTSAKSSSFFVPKWRGRGIGMAFALERYIGHLQVCVHWIVNFVLGVKWIFC